MPTVEDVLFNLTERHKPKRKPPKERDEAIYLEVKVRGRTQCAVAAECGLTQGRISQIVGHVEAWRRSSERADIAKDGKYAQCRLDRALERQRLEEMYVRGLRAQERAEQPITTERSGERDDKAWSEKSVRQQPASVQGLKTALRAIELLWKLEAQPQGEETKWGDERFEVAKLVDQLYWLRKNAVADGLVPRSEDAREVVERMLRELVGAESSARVSDPAEGSDRRSPALRETCGREACGVGDPRTTAETPDPDDTNASRGSLARPTATHVSARPIDRRIANKLNSLGVNIDELEPEIAAAMLAPIPEPAKSCTAAPPTRPDDSSWIYVPVKRLDISPPLTPAQREARRELLPRMEWTNYDEHGNEVRS